MTAVSWRSMSVSAWPHLSKGSLGRPFGSALSVRTSRRMPPVCVAPFGNPEKIRTMQENVVMVLSDEEMPRQLLAAIRKKTPRFCLSVMTDIIFHLSKPEGLERIESLCAELAKDIEAARSADGDGGSATGDTPESKTPSTDGSTEEAQALDDPYDEVCRKSTKARETMIRDYLMEQNVQLNCDGEAGRSLLHYAVMSYRPDMVDILIFAGVDVDATDSTSNTPLHYAVRKGYEIVVRQLVAAGADRTLRNRDGQTPAELYKQKHSHPSVKDEALIEILEVVP